MKLQARTAVAGALLAGLLAAPLQAQRAHIGAHGGYNFDRDRGLAGAQMLLPIAPSIELYPSFDYYVATGGSLLAFNGDVKVRFPVAPATDLYFGGGVNVFHSSAGGASATDTGWDLLFGLESRRGVTHPYLEGRSLRHGVSQFQLLAGLNITLY